AHRAALAARFPNALVNDLGRTVYLRPTPEPEPTGRGTILIVTAGTSDLPVAEEAAVTAQAFRNTVARLTDVGVAGIHRLLTQTELLRSAAVIIVVAGMEGALPSVVGGLVLGPLVRVWLADEPLTRASDFEHTLDLLRRAHGARAGWAVGFDGSEVEVLGAEEVDGAVRQRGAALVQLASVDGRAHVARDPAGSYIAVGDFPFGAGLLLSQPDATPENAAAVTEELRRVVAGIQLPR